MLRQLLATASTAVLTAQEVVPPERFIPADAIAVLRVAAPRTWWPQVTQTKVGKAIAASALAPWLAQAGSAFSAFCERAEGRGMPTEVLQGLLHDYRGELIVSVCADLDAPEPTPWTALVVLTPDGSSLLEGLLRGFRATDAPYEDQAVDVQIGEHRFRTADDTSRSRMTQVEFVDGHLVAFAGTDFEQRGAAMLATTARREALPTSAPISLHLDLAAFAQAAARRVRERVADDDPESLLPASLRLFGLSAIQSLQATVGTTAEDLELQLTLRTDGTDPGLGGLFLGASGTPAITRWLPPGCKAFQANTLAPAAFRGAIDAFLAALGEIGDDRRAALEASVLESTGMRWHDLFDAFGNELLVLGDARELLEISAETSAGRRPDPNAVFAGYCVAVQLRNGEALATAIDQALRKAGLHAARKTETYRDRPVHRLRLGLLEIEYAIADNLLLLVVGSRGVGNEALRGVLDAVADGGGLPDGIRTRIQDLPPGWTGVGSTPWAELLRTFHELAQANVRRQGRTFLSDDLMSAIQAATTELGRRQLGDAISVTYTSAAELRTIFRW